ncbi:hypothetical protein P691DRAFT_661591 [Macrolepiota fuliginosa MF-IS2]|uniref:HIT-type domain-containing protein n=1 Tax=Macrolepiota fuliginosa MF-IS2 TaxID=1400762 RepID=A0A9P5XKQ0_9AGAR|nr:hypothetical protein P691DRAFT_661591 [Macrolepiota fuliginosa MF-IS2]
MTTLEPATSTPLQPQKPQKTDCALCPNPSKYTCPRCHTPTCSLSCSQSHKAATGCTGVRDKAAYIPMNKYGWGSMMDDYTFLEDVGRSVGEWGREIVKGGWGDRGRGRGGGRGRGRGGRGMMMKGRERGGRGRGGKAKKEVLKVQLEARGIEVELLPNGMERRKLNQSAWDPKSQKGHLTIQFKFHPSAETRPSSDTIQPFTLLTHRNGLSTPLLALVQKHIRDRLSKKPTNKTTSTSEQSSTIDSFPSWISPLVLPPPEDPENFTMPTFVIAAPSDPLLVARSIALLPMRNQATKPKPYYSLDPSETLLQSLRGTQFVEFPLIEVWEQFDGVIVDKKTGGVKRVGESAEPQRKRRRFNPEEGKKAIIGLVSGYGSDEEEGRKDDLVEYVESDEEDDGNEVVMEQDNVIDEEMEVGDEDEEGEDEDVDVDPTVLLELMQRAKREGKWIEEGGDDSDDFSDEEEA